MLCCHDIPLLVTLSNRRGQVELQTALLTSFVKLTHSELVQRNELQSRFRGCHYGAVTLAIDFQTSITRTSQLNKLSSAIIQLFVKPL